MVPSLPVSAFEFITHKKTKSIEKFIFTNAFALLNDV
jgi:hypothetical protein